MYICIYAYTYIYAYVSLYVYMFLYIYLYTCFLLYCLSVQAPLILQSIIAGECACWPHPKHKPLPSAMKPPSPGIRIKQGSVNPRANIRNNHPCETEGEPPVFSCLFLSTISTASAPAGHTLNTNHSICCEIAIS